MSRRGKDPSLTVVDDLRRLEQKVVARLDELKPLIEEYDELRRVAERLGVDVDVDTGDARRPPGGTQVDHSRRAGTRHRDSQPRPPSGRSSRSRPGGTRATGAERRARVLELIEQRPGITVPEISKELEVAPPPLYRVVRKLLAGGIVTKEGTGLRCV